MKTRRIDTASKPAAVSGSTIETDFVPALALLGEAKSHALAAERDTWEFALDVKELRWFGIKNCTLRSLICRGLIEHAIDVTTLGDTKRCCRTTSHLQFTDQSCFMLTATGESYLDGTLAQTKGLPAPHLAFGQSPPETSPVTPEWNDETRVLCLGTVVIKQYRVPAPVQAAILSTFQEEGWPARIDDPLPPDGNGDPKQR